MHFTKVITKDGREYSGPIWTWRPWLNWVEVCVDMNEMMRFSFDEIKSMVTENARVSIKSPLEGETRDELERAREDLKQARANNWDNFTLDTPLFDWEKKLERHPNKS